MTSVNPEQHAYYLYLPKWYPSEVDPQLGVFVKKQASAVSDFKKVIVLYVTGIDELSAHREFSFFIDTELYEFTGYYKKSRGPFRKILNGYRYLKVLRRLFQEIIRDHGLPLLIHSHVLLRPALISWYYSRKYQIPFLHTEHWTGFVYDAYKNKSVIYRFLCRLVSEKAAALVSVSEGLSNALHTHKIRNNHEFIIPNVIESNATDYKKPADNDRIIILTVADFVEKNKNIGGTLRALAECRKQEKRIEFHLVGDGPDKEALLKLIKEYDPFSQWITLYGRRDNDFVLDILQKADFLITNSNIETFSMITAEALAAGKPVIATRCGGPEYFITEANGILISPGDHNELKQAIERMIRDYKKYDAEEISSEILAKFGREAVGNALRDIYETLQKR